MSGNTAHRATGALWILLLFLLHVATALVVLGANPFNHQSITPLDVLVKQRAWRWIDPAVEVRQSERTDIINGLLPTWIAVRDQLHEGRFPVWNDKYSGGSTLLVTNNSTYTPGFLLFAAIPNPSLGFHMAIVLNLALGGLGIHLFLRRRLPWAAAFCGAITFQFCGFFAAWLYWPHVFTAIWAPWLLLAIDRCAEGPSLQRALPIAAASALLILGGFPFVAELAFGMGGLYFVVLWFSANRPPAWRRDFTIWYVAGTFLGFLLCALPLLELAAFLQQYDLGYRENRGSYLDASYMTRLLPPWAYEHLRVEQTMYVGVAMTLFALAAAVAAMFRWKLASSLERFGLLLLVISAALVFGLVPMALVGWVPGMSFNSWSRGIVLLDIALVVLGATAIAHVWNWSLKLRTGRWVLACLGLLIVAQVVEISFFFKRYNGPVSSAYFYPPTPATDYMVRRAGPFDYVIADDSFHITGALGAYGLREWFGHQFRTPELKTALRHMVPSHFSSQTSSRFSRADIRAESPTLAAMNVRYLAVSSADPHAEGPGAKRPAKHRPLPPIPGHRWSQQFEVGEPTLLRGVTLRLANYRRTDMEGEVELRLSDASGDILAVSRRDAAGITDNAMADFFFPEPVELAQGAHAFTLQFSPVRGIENPRLTAWAAEQHVPGTLLRVDGNVVGGVIEYVLQSGSGQMGMFRHVLTAHGISVFENTRSPDGPYFVEQLTDVPTTRSARNVRIDRYAPDNFALSYTGHQSGFVVVPMSGTDTGWNVRVNGVPTNPESMLGVMPAVPVEGPARISFVYRAYAARFALPWLGSLLVVLLGLYFLQRWIIGGARRKRQTGVHAVQG